MLEKKQREMQRPWSSPKMELHNDSSLRKYDLREEVRALGSLCLRKDVCEAL